MKIDLEFLKKKSADRFTGLRDSKNPDQLVIVNHNIGLWAARNPDQTGAKVRDYESIEEMLIDYKKIGYLDGFTSVRFYPDIENVEERYEIPLTLINTLIKESGNEQD